MRDNTSFNRRAYLKAAGALGLAGSIGLAGCSDTNDSTADTATGTLSTAVKDAPGDIDDFESCVVTIDGIWVKSADSADDEGTAEPETDAMDEDEPSDDDDVDQGDGRTYYEFDEGQEADLVQLQDGNTKLVDDREIPVGSYRYLQLDVSNVEGTLVGGETAEVDTPGNAPLQFKHTFEVREDQRTVFTADFTPVKRGQTNRYLFQPVASGTAVSYEAEPEATTTAEPVDDETTTEPVDDETTTEAT